MIMIAAATSLIGATSCADAGAGSLSASNPAVGANPGDSAALYVELDNDGATDTLLSARCNCSDTTSLHLTEDRDGILLMVESDAIGLPGQTRTELRPGGSHVMLEDLEAPLTAGSTVEVTLSFERSPELVLEVPVVALEELAERVEITDGSRGDS